MNTDWSSALSKSYLHFTMGQECKTLSQECLWSVDAGKPFEGTVLMVAPFWSDQSSHSSTRLKQLDLGTQHLVTIKTMSDNKPQQSQPLPSCQQDNQGVVF